MTSEAVPKSNPERKPVNMTYEEWQFLSAETNAGDKFFGESEIRGLLNRYGIELNSGMIEVEIDGQKYMMDTNKDNFGVIDPPPEPRPFSDYP